VIGETRSSNENITDADLDAVMEQAPKGAMALAGIATLLLLIGYSFVYFFIFIPRGVVG
jgi:Cytochrome c oxidase subunit IIa family